MSKLRWGILGAANIARKNWKAFFHSGNNTITAVAARDPARASRFVSECQAQHAFEPTPTVLDRYEEVLASSNVEAVYLPLPTNLRKDWVIRAAEAGKHVLCEKPCAIRAADLREMIGACREHGVQFMDGVMFMHNPRMAALRTVLDDARRIGTIRRIMSVFSFAGDEATFHADIRVQAGLEPAGCLGDLGWYCIRFALFTMRWELPDVATGRILECAEDGRTPKQFSGELIFRGGGSAGFYCSFVTESQQWVTVSGSKGTVRLADFVHPKNTYESAFEVNQIEHRWLAPSGTEIPLHPGALTEFGHPTAQDTRMLQHFAEQVRSNQLNPEWPNIALKTQLVMDACLASARQDSRPVTICADSP